MRSHPRAPDQAVQLAPGSALSPDLQELDSSLSASPMHELAIAQGIVDLVTRQAGGRTVLGVEVRLGRLREVVPESLDFAFALLTAGTVLDGAELEIAQVAGGELAVDGLRLCDTRAG